MKDVLGEALSDYYQHGAAAKLWVHNKYGPKEEMRVAVYFRDADKMPELEWIALQHCKGRVLDIGAGAGSHSLVLQQMGLDVTALDLSPGAASVMEQRGVKKILRQDFFELSPGDLATAGTGVPANHDRGIGAGVGTFDTLLLMMNGIGLAGTLDGLRRFLGQARKIMAPGATLIFDSSDLAYMYDGKVPAGLPEYYGEILYQYGYRRQRSDWFKWLFIDRKTLTSLAAEEGWRTELLFEDESDQYLVKCKPAN